MRYDLALYVPAGAAVVRAADASEVAGQAEIWLAGLSMWASTA